MNSLLKGLATILTLSSVTLIHAYNQDTTVGMSESGIRLMASEKPLPDYPAESVRRGRSGVAVASLLSNAEGRVSDVTILEAPDDLIAAAVHTALLQWRVEPTTVRGETMRRGLRGKITFYFRITSGKGRVFHPEEMPGGPKPEPAQGPPPGPPGTSLARAGGPPAVGSRPAIMTHEAPADIEIGEAELKTLQASSRAIVLDVRERDDFGRQHRPGAINIPDNELAIRAYVEVDRQRPVVIDCTYTETRVCQAAANRLLRGPKIATVLILIP